VTRPPTRSSFVNRNRAASPGAQPPSPEAAGRRPGSLFSRFLGTPFSSDRGGGVGEGSAITVEPSTDPASEAALKRRIERQIHESLGDRVQDVEIRILGRDVTIRARAARFWQRRSVRRSLESLPGLTGYPSKVEIID
jgi:hypothetical protein